jgi:hypothetical protein
MSALGSISAARRFPTNGRNRRYLAVDCPVGEGPQTTQNRSQNEVKNYWSARSAGAEAVDEIGEADLPGAAQPLGGDDRLHEADAVLDIAIDDDAIVFRPVAHLGGREAHLECRLASGSSRSQAEVRSNRRLMSYLGGSAETPGSYLSCAQLLLPFTRRQDQLHGGAPAVALPFDLAAELLSEAVDQPAAEPGIGASRIEPNAIVGDRQAKLPGHPL